MRMFGALIVILLLGGVVLWVMHMLAASVGAVSKEGKERREFCVSNQRELATAIQMYMQDHNANCFPDPVDKAWTTYLGARVANPIAFDCPSTQRTGAADTPDYGINAAIFGKTEAQLPAPATTIFTADLAPSAARGSYSVATENDLDVRHTLKRAVVVSAADGHVVPVVRQSGETLTQALQRMKLSLNP
jgi:hypothetical protein